VCPTQPPVQMEQLHTTAASRTLHCCAYETSHFVPRDRLSLRVSRNFPQTLLAKFGIIVQLEYGPFLEQLLQFFVTLKAPPFSATCCNHFIPTIGKCNAWRDFARAQRLGWYGHIETMQETRTIKAIYTWKPISKKPTG